MDDDPYRKDETLDENASDVLDHLVTKDQERIEEPPRTSEKDLEQEEEDRLDQYHPKGKG